jgi:uncharacterized membrane protein
VIGRYAILAGLMRLKLVLLAALLGTLLGAGVPIAIFAVTAGWRAFSPDKPGYHSGSWSVLLVYLPPLLAAALAAFFVYRHTARHRKLQAVLTGILVLALCVVAYFVAVLLVPAIR